MSNGANRESLEPIAGGWPKLVPTIFLLMTPLILSGPLRAITAMTLGPALACASLATALLILVLWPWIRQQARTALAPKSLLLEALVLVPALYAAWALYNPDFEGFMTTAGWDGGSHVYFKNSFVDKNPGEYHGFVAYYALCFWLERLFGINVFYSFTAAFYLSVMGFIVLPLTLAFAYIRRAAEHQRAALIVGVLAATTYMVVVVRTTLLSLFHYNQALGFFSHLFGLLPLGLLWAVDSLVRAEALRVSGILFALGLMRYTYGLNLPDALVAGAAVILVGAPRGRPSGVHRVLAAGMLAAALKGYVALLPLFDIYGYIHRFNLYLALELHLAVPCVFALVLVTSRRALGTESVASLVPWLRFPLLFAVVSSIAWAAFRAGHPNQSYYVTKYQIWTSFLLVGAGAILAGDVAVRLVKMLVAPGWWRDLSGWLRVGLLASIPLLGPWGYALTYQAYSTTLPERLNHHGAPYKFLRPFADTEALRRIGATLAEKKKDFGGYLSTFFPLFSFMNAAYHYHTGVQEFFSVDQSPGRCVFWVAAADDTFSLGEALAHADSVRTTRDALSRDPASTCVSYAVKWKTTPQSLCYRCY